VCAHLAGRIVWIAGLLLTITFAWATPSLPQNCTMEQEPNDTIEQAQAIPSLPGSSCVAGEITEGNADLFAFDLRSDHWVTLVTTALEDGDTTLTLYDRDGTEISYNDDRPSGGRDSQIDECLAAGRYIVRIGSYGDEASFHYVITVLAFDPCERAPERLCPFAEHEPNDEPGWADIGPDLPNSYCFDAYITPGDADLFGFHVAEPVTVRIAAEPVYSGDTTLTLLDEYDNEVAFNDDNPEGGLESVVEACLEPGRYYALVTAYDAEATFRYTLSLEGFDPCGMGILPTEAWTVFSSTANPSLVPTQTDQPVLVLMARPTNIETPPGAVEALADGLQRKLVGPERSVHSFWSEASQGKTTFAFDLWREIIELPEAWAHYYMPGEPARIDASGAMYPLDWTGTEALVLSCERPFTATVSFPAGPQSLDQVANTINKAIGTAAGTAAVAPIRALANNGQLRLESARTGTTSRLWVSGTAATTLGFDDQASASGTAGHDRRQEAFVQALTARVQEMTDAEAAAYLSQFAGVVLAWAVDDPGFVRPAASERIGGNWNQVEIRGNTYAYATVSIPAAESWPALAHAIGHNLGFPDLYSDPPADPSGIELGPWCIMSGLDDAHPTAWIKAWKTQSAASDTSTASGSWWSASEVVSVTAPPPRGSIRPVEVLLVPSSATIQTANLLVQSPSSIPMVHAIRIDLGPGHNLYVAARERGPYQHETLGSSIHDTAIPAEGVIVTETIDRLEFAAPRVHVTLKTPMSDPIDRVGESYIFPTSPESAVTIECVEVIGSDPAVYRMKVAWGIGSFFDLRIDPSNPPSWESADIWIDTPVDNPWNVYSHSDARLNPHVPGHPICHGDRLEAGWPSRITARVWNDGDRDAYDVEVTFRAVIPPGVGPGIQIGRAMIPEIAAGSHGLATIEWTPLHDEHAHACIVAEVTRKPGELNPHNNSAREAIGDWYVVASTKAEPLSQSFQAENPLNQPHLFRIGVEGLIPGLHLDVSPVEFWLEPGSSISGQIRLRTDEEVPLEAVPLEVKPPDAGREAAQGSLVSLHVMALVGDAWTPAGGLSGLVHRVLPAELETAWQTSGATGILTVQARSSAGPIPAANIAAQLVDHYGNVVWIDQTQTDAQGRTTIAVDPPMSLPRDEGYVLSLALSPTPATAPAAQTLEVRF